MNALAFILLLVGLPNLTLERASYLLGPDSEIVEALPYRYLAHPRLPFALIFLQDPSSPSAGRIYSFWFRRGFLVAPGTHAYRKKLQGEWIFLPIALPIFPHTTIFSNDIATINYGFFQHRFFYEASLSGRILRVDMSFPLKEDRLAFMNDPNGDHGLASQYFLLDSNAGISWRPSSATALGLFSLCIRQK